MIIYPVQDIVAEVFLGTFFFFKGRELVVPGAVKLLTMCILRCFFFETLFFIQADLLAVI